MSTQKIDITGASGVGVDASALQAQKDRFDKFARETSATIERAQATLGSPSVLFVVVLAVFMLAIEIVWGSYFKTQDSRDFAKGSSKFVRSMTYFSWISGTIIAFGIVAYLGASFIDIDPNAVAKAMATLIAVYFMNALVTGFGGAPTYTILGNFLAIK